SSSADEDGLYCQARTSPSIICQGNTYSCAFVGVSDSHQIQDWGSLLKNLLILCGIEGIFLEEFFDNPKNPRTLDFLSKVL
ncbi:hypothetical protein, partial [Clostridium neonatale]|uniref:hypothetical protein n=1 Tax=Clostridium neonatale TaxID=137838 RepID=UPI002936E5E7